MPDAPVIQLRQPGGVSARSCAGDPRLAVGDRVRCEMPTYGDPFCWYHGKVDAGLIGTYGHDAKPHARWQ